MAVRQYVAIIDDDRSLCRSLSRLLEQAGFHPIAFLSAEEFLADSLRPQFACLLVDIQLGGMSGIELHKQLLAEGNRTPVIYITAYDDPEAESEAWRAGCAALHRKTDAGSDIIESIRRAAHTT